MKKFGKSILLFTLIMIPIYILLLIIWEIALPPLYKKNLNYIQGSAGFAFSRFQEVKQKQNIDVLFLGSSHTYRGFDTRIFAEEGITSFNLGSSSQSPIQTKILLNRYLDKLNPKVVVYEVYPQTFSMDGIEAGLDLISNDYIDFELMKMGINLKNIKVLNTLTFTTLKNTFVDYSAYKEVQSKYGDTYIPGGFAERKMGFYQPKKFEKQDWELKESQFQKFDGIIHLLRARNIKVLLVLAPITKNWYTCHTNTTTFEERIKKSGNYYNFNHSELFNDSLHFYDKDHLNQNGVTLFNREIIRILNSQNFLNKKR